MQKTQLTSAIEKIHNTRVNLEKELEAKPLLDTNTVTRHVLEQKIFTYIGIEDYLISLLPKEREDMENMAEHGFAENEKWTINAESIFDQHYSQYKP